VIVNAKNKSLKSQVGTLPNVSSGMTNWFQKLSISKVIKEVVNYIVQESYIVYDFMGVIQVLSPEDLVIKPEMQVSWKWWQLHTDTSVALNPDDIIIYECQKYRVMNKIDHNKYGYYEYHLVEDYKENA
jgi:hypothetical protein